MGNWCYVSNGEGKGPVSEDDLHRLLVDGALTANSLVWKQGMKGWQSVGRIDELASLLPPEIPPAPKVSVWHRMRRHLGSSIALLFGCLGIIGGFFGMVQSVDAPHVSDNLLIGGAVMLLGALAYRSAKMRKLGEAKSTLTRQFWEIGLLVLTCVVILAQNNLKYLIATDPVPNVLVPVWAIVAYLVIAFMPIAFMQRAQSR